SATAPRPKTCASEPPRSPRKDSPHDRPRHPARRRHRRPRAGPPHPRQPGPRRPRRAGRRVRARPVRRGLAAHPPPAAHPAPPRRRPALGRMAQGRRPHPQPHRGGAVTPRMTTYLERGRPVAVLARHRLPSKANPAAPCPLWLTWTIPPRGAPRNVLVRREDGELAVRPFRGLRRPA